MGSNPPPLLTDTFKGILPSIYLQAGSNPPPPLTDTSTGILPSASLQEGSTPPPPLRDTLKGIFSSTDFNGIKSATPSDGRDGYVMDTFKGILPTTCLQEGSNPPPPLTNASAGKFYLPEGSNSPPIVPSTDLKWDQIRHPLWPIHPMGYYLPFIFNRDQIRHPIWRIRPLGNCLPLLFKRINCATPSDGYVRWDIAFTSLQEGWNPPPPLTDTFKGILPTTCLQEGSNPPSDQCVRWEILSPRGIKSATDSTFHWS